MLTFKEYAQMNGITYEAVRAQVKRYEKDLSGHIQKVGRKQFLDDVAVAFLDEKRQEHPVILKEQGKDEHIRSLEEQVKFLLAENARLANEALEVQKINNELALENKEVKMLQQSVADRDEQIASQTAKIAEISSLIEEKDKSLEELEKELELACMEVGQKTLEIEYYENQSLLDRLFKKKYVKQG